MDQTTLRNGIYAALFAALIIIGTFIRIPLGPVPIVLANLFVILAGLFLGPLWGAVSVALYLLIGALGLPVFSAGGGAALFMGPTGGYLIGYLLGAAAAGAIARLGTERLAFMILGATAGMLVIYLIGVPWLIWRIGAATGNNLTLAQGLTMGAYPFFFGDLIKIAAAVIICRSLLRFSPAGSRRR